MAQKSEARENNSRRLAAISCLLPILLLFIASAAGVVIPLWLYLAVLAWCLLLPLFGRSRQDEASPHAEERVHLLHEGAVTREDQLNALQRLSERIDPAIFDVASGEPGPAGLIFRGTLRTRPEDAQQHVAGLAREVLARSAHVMVHEEAPGRPYIFVANAELDRALAASIPPRRPAVNLALFAATLVTTTFAGAAHQGLNVFEDPGSWTAGLPYGLGVMLILGVHEMGHYLAAQRHRVPVSLPYFIPVPFALGTFGAFIRMPPLLKNRRQLFDIGVAGPLAGLAVAIPALALGLQWSTVVPVDPGGGMPMGQGVSVNASALLAFVAKTVIGESLTTGHYLVLHPLAFAGWLGLMITALNLLPVGQLDGGHIAHALFGRARAHVIGRATLFAMVGLGLFVWSGLLFWALIVFFIAGTAGMPPMEDVTPLGVRRRAVAWSAFALLALILLPVPHALSPQIGLHCPYL